MNRAGLLRIAYGAVVGVVAIGGLATTVDWGRATVAAVALRGVFRRMQGVKFGGGRGI